MILAKPAEGRLAKVILTGAGSDEVVIDVLVPGRMKVLPKRLELTGAVYGI